MWICNGGLFVSILFLPFALGEMSIDLPCPTTLTFRMFKIRFRWFKNTVSSAVGSSTKMRYTFNGFGRDGLFVTFPLGRNWDFIYKPKLPLKWIFALVRWPLESQNNAQIMNLPCTHDLLKTSPLSLSRDFLAGIIFRPIFFHLLAIHQLKHATVSCVVQMPATFSDKGETKHLTREVGTPRVYMRVM